MGLVNHGMGGYLNPPTHPEYDWSIQIGNGSMSLSYAIECEWLNQHVKDEAKEKLESWIAPPIDSPEIQAWIRQVLVYYHNCYQGKTTLGDVAWHAANLSIEPNTDPITNADRHAGIHLIRKYYPDFVPTREHF